VDLVESLVPKMNIIFMVDTLEYLHKGGRIGGASALIGSLLNIKPILCVADGRIEPLEKQRSRRRAIQAVLDRMAESVGESQAVHAAVLHCDAPEEGQALADRLAEQFNCVELIVSETGPVIGVHAGPGTVGVAFYVE
jgi:DegV family protein with EDD domain